MKTRTCLLCRLIDYRRISQGKIILLRVCTLLAPSAILGFWVLWPLHDSQMPLVGSSSEIQWLRMVSKKICHCPLCIHGYVCVRCFSKMYLMWIFQFRNIVTEMFEHEYLGKSVHGLQNSFESLHCKKQIR